MERRIRMIESADEGIMEMTPQQMRILMLRAGYSEQFIDEYFEINSEISSLIDELSDCQAEQIISRVKARGDIVELQSKADELHREIKTLQEKREKMRIEAELAM